MSTELGAGAWSYFGDPRAVALALEGTAGALALGGDAERAASLLGTAAAARDPRVAAAVDTGRSADPEEADGCDDASSWRWSPRACW